MPEAESKEYRQFDVSKPVFPVKREGRFSVVQADDLRDMGGRLAENSEIVLKIACHLWQIHIQLREMPMLVMVKITVGEKFEKNKNIYKH